MANNFELNLGPDAFIPDTTNGPTFGIDQNRLLLAYDDGTTETAYSRSFACPATYTGSGTLKADVFYKMASATSGTLEWEVAVEAVTPGDATDLDAGSSFDTANSGTATVPGTAGYMQMISVTLTNKDSIAAGDLVRLSIARDADDGTNDTATGDAHILNVLLREEA